MAQARQPPGVPAPEMSVEVGFGGTVTHHANGSDRATWHPEVNVLAVPYNHMVPGYRSDAVNTLRLWRAEAAENLDLNEFNSGDFQAAVRQQTEAESISKVLYPEDSTPAGKRLRLQQQYFFVAASIHDFIHNVPPGDFDLRRLHERVVFQLNDTHPVIAIPELMRVPHGRERPALGRGLERHPAVLPHLPHAAARGARGGRWN